MIESNTFVPMPRTAQNAALGIGFERKLPDLGRGQRILVWSAGQFREAEVIRRCPGPIYWAKLTGGSRRGQNELVSCNNFGGLVDAG